MTTYGPISAVDLREVMLVQVRSAMQAVRSGSDGIAVEKLNYDGTPGDFATLADLSAQDACEAVRLELMPWAGVIGEERGLRIPCALPGKSEWFAYFAYDALDGTKHFKGGARKDGVASMAAFVYDGKVVAAAIGDVFKGYIYLLNPANGKVYLHDESSRFLAPINLSARPPDQPLVNGTLLLRGDPAHYHPLVAELVKESIFPYHEHQTTFSFALTMAGLWTGRYTMHVQGGTGYATAWDDTPVIGINTALEMVYLQPSQDGTALEEFVPRLITGDPVERPINTVVVHKLQIAPLRQLVPVRLLAGA